MIKTRAAHADTLFWMKLTHSQIASLRRGLEQRRATLVREARDDAEKARAQSFAELAGSSPDTGDESVADLIADINNAELSRDLRELGDVEAALRRIQRGKYGTCLDCADDIPFQRLEAEPAAQRCLPCQARRERGRVRPAVKHHDA